MAKFKLKTLVTTMAALGLYSLSSSSFADQKTVDEISQQLQVKYTIVDNLAADHGTDCSALGADWGACNKITIELNNQGKAIESKDWQIYFHSIRQIIKVENDQFSISHITGDLHKLVPTDKFKGFQAKSVIEIPIIAEYWQLFQTDIMPRWYVTSSKAKAKVIANTNSEELALFSTAISGEQWKRTKDDHNVLMTAATRFDKNQDVKRLSALELRGQILPTPAEVVVHQQNANLATGVHFKLADTKVLASDSLRALSQRFEQLGVKIADAGYPITISIDAKAFANQEAIAGAYLLKIGETGAIVRGFDAAGAFYGVQSILSLISVSGNKTIATLEAKDAPRFAYRGMFLDVGRNFHSKEAVLRLLDQMAAYKLNKFHFHLTDDEGWRIEIPGLPELTEIGGKRCHDLSEMTCLLPQLGSGPDSNNMGSGYFTRADYIEIVKYANARQIEVIPEIDVPAHARAAVMAMEARYNKLHKAGKEMAANEFRLIDPTDTSNTTSVQFYDRHSYLNPCLASSKRFVDKIIAEMAAMHKLAGQPMTTWHFGGDEAKNIRLGAGYQDKNAAEKVNWKGSIDMSGENKPWAKSTVCQNMVNSGTVKDVDHLSSFFAIEVSKLVNAHGIEKMQAWQDGLKEAKDSNDFATKRVGVNFWDTLYWGGFDTINDWANKGYEVTVSNPDYVYFDMPYEVNPHERGYYWATRFNDERKVFAFAANNMPQNAETSVDRDGNPFSAKSDKEWPGAYGLSGQSWSETVRTDNQMEYMIYPRLLPLAERAWHRAGWELDYQKGKEFKGGETKFVDQSALNADWTRFANLLGQRELAKLDQAGIAYRLPLPGAKVINGMLEANVALPGLLIEYSINGGKEWLHYDDRAKPKVIGDVSVRSVSHDGKRFSRLEQVTAK